MSERPPRWVPLALLPTEDPRLNPPIMPMACIPKARTEPARQRFGHSLWRGFRL
jgi:hypothetical protein